MKTIQFYVAGIVAIISYATIGIPIVSGIPQKFRGSDGRDYLIEKAFGVTNST